LVQKGSVRSISRRINAFKRSTYFVSGPGRIHWFLGRHCWLDGWFTIYWKSKL